MNSRERFLSRLGAEAGKGLSPQEAAAIVAEARHHLEESIQARLELGDLPEEAEREALRAFGTAEAIGRKAAPRGPLVDCRFVVWALGSVAYWPIVGPRSWPAWATVSVLGLALVLHVGLWVASAHARRPQWLALATIFGTLWLAYSVPNALDSARFVRDNIAGGFARNRARHAALDQEERSLHLGYERFVAGLEDRSPSRVPSYEPDGTLRLFERPDRQTAAAHWANALKAAPIRFRYERADLAESDVRQAWLARTPWYGLLPREMGRLFASTGWSVASFYFGTHLFAWIFGQALRRRRQTGAVA